ncbi:MAG: alpha/beta hydrolase [Paracoccaceae bacterium]
MISVTKRGDAGAQPVVLIHGSWHGAWCWEGNYLEYFAEQGFEAIAIDLRGHGNSPAVRNMRLNRISHYADDVEHVIAELSKPPVVIGHSMGGFIAQHLLARDVLMRGVGLLTPVPYTGAIGTTLRVIRTMPLTFLKAIFTLSLYPVIANRERAAKIFLGDDASRDVADKLAKNLQDESFFAFCDMLILNLPKHPKGPTPVCVVGAGQDTLISVKSVQKTGARLGANVNIIADAPHDLMLAPQWEQSAQIFLDWINELPE